MNEFIKSGFFMLKQTLLRKFMFMLVMAFAFSPVTSVISGSNTSIAYAQASASETVTKKKKKKRKKRKISRKNKQKQLAKKRTNAAVRRASSLKKDSGAWWIQILGGLGLLFLASWMLQIRRRERFETLPQKGGFKVPSYFPQGRIQKQMSNHNWTGH
ncbi:MAG: hypothetical protein HRU09_16285 [Oligoflexales bacterium]|nr:hypothetical protein [Oligoflexales bacterium]